MCYNILCSDSVIAVKYGWMDSWLHDEVTPVLLLRLFFVFFTKITTEVSNWTEEEPAASDACEYNLFCRVKQRVGFFFVIFQSQ